MNLEEFWNSEKGKKATERFRKKLIKEEKFRNRWVDKTIKLLENKSDEELSSLYDKFLKHNIKRQDILFTQGIDGESDLYYYLFKAVSEIGVESTHSIFDWRGYRIELYCGQGCFYCLSKI